MNYFDKALNDVLDGIERNVVDQVREAASAALEEYPSKKDVAGRIQPAGNNPSMLNFQRWFQPLAFLSHHSCRLVSSSQHSSILEGV